MSRRQALRNPAKGIYFDGIGFSGQSAGGPVLVADGLLAEYRFNDGSGSQLTDYSGNAHHGTISGASWAAGAGLTFVAGNYVDLPVALLADVKTVQAFCSPPITGDGVNILGASAADAWGTNGQFTQYALPNFVNDSGLQLRPYEPFFGYDLVTWITDGVAQKVYNGPYLAQQYAAQSNGGPTRSGVWLRVGSGPSGANFSGRFDYLALYDRALTADEVSANALAMRSIVQARGGQVGYSNASTTRQLIGAGDSITGNGLSGGAEYWFIMMTLAQTWTRSNFAIPSRTVRNIATVSTVSELPIYASGAPRNVYCIFAGTNDGLAGRTASEALADLQTAVNAALSKGCKVIIVPMLSRTTLDTFKNTYNGLIAGASWGSNVALVPTATFPNLCPDGSYANATYFSDETHPTATGQSELAAGIATYVDAFA